MCKISTGKSQLAGRSWLLEACLVPWLKHALGRDPEVKSRLILGARNGLKPKVQSPTMDSFTEVIWLWQLT